MTGWPEVELGDHVDLLAGFAFKSARFFDESDQGVRLLRGDNVGQGVLRWNGAKHWAASEYPDFERYHLSEGDVILAMDRPWIEAGLKYACVRKSDLPCLLVQRVSRMRGLPTLDTAFLRYLIGSSAFTGHVQGIITGVNVPHISGRDIKRFRFRLPPLETQRRIAAILGAYDDLIEVNRRRVVVLEEMARGLFEEWFVRFRFPGHEAVSMVDTPDGSLPQGWCWGTLGDYLEERRDKASPGEHLSGRRYVPIECIGRRTFALSEHQPWENAQSSLQLFERGDFLFGAMRAYFHKVAPAPFAGITRTTCFVLRPRSLASAAYALLTLFQDRTVAYAAAKSSGSTIPYAKWSGVLERMAIPLPDEEIVSSFNIIVWPMVEMIMNLAETTEKLAASRDLLLPRLISGQLSLEAAEHELEDAA